MVEEIDFFCYQSGIGIYFSRLSLFCFHKADKCIGSAAAYSPKGDGLSQLLGAVMFLGYFVVVGFYIWIIKRSSPKIDLIEEDAKTGEQKVKRKWFDIILQIVVIITGMVARWAYLMFIYRLNYRV